MKTDEEYLINYRKNKEELSNKGELWRLRVKTEEEFLCEIEKIREYKIENQNNSVLNKSFLQRSINGMIALLFQNGVTYEEVKAQAESVRKNAEISFAKEAPEIQLQLKQIQTPLSFDDTRNIYRWLFRKQITIEMIPEKVLNEFIKTDLYQKIVRTNENESF